MDIKLRLLARQAAAVDEERRAGNSRLAAKQVSSQDVACFSALVQRLQALTQNTGFMTYIMTGVHMSTKQSRCVCCHLLMVNRQKWTCSRESCSRQAARTAGLRK